MARGRVLALSLSFLMVSGCAHAAASTAEQPAPRSPQPFVVPLSSVGGRYLTTVQVGGGRPVRVIVDTGSSGLVIDAAAVGHSVPTGQQLQRTYGLSAVRTRTFSTSLVKTTVSVRMGSRSLSTGTILVASFADSSRDALMRSIGASGILGIGPNIAPNSEGLLSPFAQLQAPYWQGFTVDAAAGALRLGLPAVRQGSIAVGLTAAAALFPNGHPSWSKQVDLCWSVQSQRVCGPTAVDSGGNYGTVSSTLMPGLPYTGHRLAPGTRVLIATAGGQTIGSVLTTPVHPVTYAPTSHFNTGMVPFIGAAVSFDLLHGDVVFSPH